MAVLNLYPAQQFSTGELLTATVLNSPLQVLQAWSTTIDNTNIGAAGIYASQLSPTNNAQATFGGISGYFFTAPSANTTPLTVTSLASAVAQTLVVQMGASQSMQGLLINGASNITGNILEADLTAGGTKALALTSAGLLTVNTNGLQVAPAINSTNTLGYVPPVYTNAGSAQASTVHVVTGQTVVATGAGGSGSAAVSLSGAAVFTSASTYSVIAQANTAAQSFYVASTNSGTQFTITQTSGLTNSNVTYNWIAIGT